VKELVLTKQVRPSGLVEFTMKVVKKDVCFSFDD